MPYFCAEAQEMEPLSKLYVRVTLVHVNSTKTVAQIDFSFVLYLPSNDKSRNFH